MNAGPFLPRISPLPAAGEFLQLSRWKAKRMQQPGFCRWFRPAQRPPPESRSPSAEEKMSIARSIYPQFEVQFLEFLKELQPIQINALNSLGGKKPVDFNSSYLGRVAVTVNRTSDGYLWLRESGRMDASKFLIRPTLEAVFCGTAAMANKDFLFRKAYSEWVEDKKLFSADAADEKEADAYLERLKQRFREDAPEYSIKCRVIKVREIAEMGGLSTAYNEYYRIYCRFTHSAMMAVSGNLNQLTDSKDTHVIVWCALMMLNQLKQYTPADIPNLMPFNEKLLLLNSYLPKNPTTTRFDISKTPPN